MKHLNRGVKGYNSIETSIIWAEKITFLRKAINKNYFNSKCFYWIDADLVKEKYLKLLQNKPSNPAKCLKDERVLFFTYPYTRHGYKKQWPKFYSMFEKNSIPPKKFFLCHILWAGFFGGQKRKINELYKIFYMELDKWQKKGIYVWNEENLYSYISIHYPNIIKVVKVKKSFYVEMINILK